MKAIMVFLDKLCIAQHDARTPSNPFLDIVDQPGSFVVAKRSGYLDISCLVNVAPVSMLNMSSSACTVTFAAMDIDPLISLHSILSGKQKDFHVNDLEEQVQVQVLFHGLKPRSLLGSGWNLMAAKTSTS